jgi:hypothetical protein
LEQVKGLDPGTSFHRRPSMRFHPALIPLCVCVAVAACTPHPALAQAPPAYSMPWNSLAGGGQSSGGAYVLGSTTGQAGASALAGGSYTLSGGFWSGSSASTAGVGADSSRVPRVFAARLAGANPTQGASVIRFDLPSANRVSVDVYGVDGRLVRRLVDGAREAGRHTAYWDGTDGAGSRVVPGMYFARVRAGQSQAMLRIVRIH